MTKVSNIYEWLGPTLDWSLERYHAMINTGVFDEDDRFELLFGKIVPMSPIGRFHATCLRKINRYFIKFLGDDYECSPEQPITLSNNSEPEPDYTIARLKENNYLGGHPKSEDILLVVEISDQTLNKDRTVKSTIYAQATLPEYWIINLIERQLEVYTDPEQAAYLRVAVFKEGEQFEHRLLGTVAVSDLLP